MNLTDPTATTVPETVVRTTTPWEWDVLVRRFQTRELPSFTAVHFGCTTEDVRRCEARAMHKLRSAGLDDGTVREFFESVTMSREFFEDACL